MNPTTLRTALMLTSSLLGGATIGYLTNNILKTTINQKDNKQPILTKPQSKGEWYRTYGTLAYLINYDDDKKY